jgi:hypothetical protein
VDGVNEPRRRWLEGVMELGPGVVSRAHASRLTRARLTPTRGAGGCGQVTVIVDESRESSELLPTYTSITPGSTTNRAELS